MIALDTSALIDYFGRSNTAAVAAVDLAFSESQACLPPVVLSELLSDPKLTPKTTELLLQIPLLEHAPASGNTLAACAPPSSDAVEKRTSPTL